MVAQHCGVHPAGNRPDLLERGLGLRGEIAEQRGRAGGALAQPLCRELEADRQRHQPLLRAVVQIALDASALAIGDGRVACARGSDLAEQRVEKDLVQQAAVELMWPTAAVCAWSCREDRPDSVLASRVKSQDRDPGRTTPMGLFRDVGCPIRAG